VERKIMGGGIIPALVGIVHIFPSVNAWNIGGKK
jgi:hypothetical protein